MHQWSCSGVCRMAGRALQQQQQHCLPLARRMATRAAAASGDGTAAAAALPPLPPPPPQQQQRDGNDAAPPAATQEKPFRVERLLANLGYGSRKECGALLKRRRLVYAATGEAAKLGEKALASQLLLDGAPLDPPPPLSLLLHKPVGYVVTSPDDEAVQDLKIYDLLPHRFGRRRPFLSAIGRLDKDTSGLLLLTDDGKLLHSIQSPARGIWKLYRATLAAPLTGKAAAAAVRKFGSGAMQLVGDRTPLLPACLSLSADGLTAEVAICEGRYHQIRRMFAALGHEVVALHRHAIGALLLDEQQLPEGEWRLATRDDIAAVLAGPDLQPDQQQQPRQEAPAAGAAGAPGQQQQPAAAVPSQALQPAQQQLEEDADGEVEADQLGATRRYRDGSRWAKRRAALARSVRAMQQQRQQQAMQQQQEQQ